MRNGNGKIVTGNGAARTAKNNASSKYEAKPYGGAWHPLTASKALRDINPKFRPALKQKHLRFRAEYERVVIGLECSKLFRDAIASESDDKNIELFNDPKVARLFQAIGDLGMTLLY